MKKEIQYQSGKMNICIRVNDNGSVELVNFSAGKFPQAMPEPPHSDDPMAAMFSGVISPVVELQFSGDRGGAMTGAKHADSSSTASLYYKTHREYDNEAGHKIEITMMASHDVEVVYHMQLFKDISMARTWTVLKNLGMEEVGVEYVSSFVYSGLGKNGSTPYYDKLELYVPHNNWCTEARWVKLDCVEAGLSCMTADQGFSNSRMYYGNTGSYTTGEYLPLGLCRDPESGEMAFWQIDVTGSWHAEYASTVGGKLEILLSGATENEAAWWKNLRPGCSFTTVPAAYGVVDGDESDAVAELTKYRRVIRRKNRDNEKCNIVFNDYMNCLMGDPTEEKELEIIDRAAEIGCEYYCVDCGWYDDGSWFTTMGEWVESKKRFPSGFRKVFDYARSKGMRAGLWLEIEVVGVDSPAARTLPEEWFFQRHGKRYVDSGRYLLDFRNPEVRKYCRDVVDRMIRDYGAEFFKVDYNCTASLGSDYQSDSFGDALVEHFDALHRWWKDIYEVYPDLVVEACSSGGQRIDYGMLSLHSLQSTSDQTDYILNSYIATSIVSALTPEQAGMWVYPYVDDKEHVVYNAVVGMLLRPYMSGKVWLMSQESLDLTAEGIALYKRIRSEIHTALPFFPLGLNSIKDKALAYGLQNENHAYLCVFGPHTDYVEMPLRTAKPVTGAKVLYPSYVGCDYKIEDNMLKVKLPVEKCARFFELTF